MSVPLALPAAIAYGVADFAGGLAARRAPLLVVLVVAQLAGLVTLLPALWLVDGRASPEAAGVGALAAVAGTAGLLLYLRGLAVGPMGVVAPLSGVVGAGLPLVIGVLGGERLGVLTVVGIAVALLAIWLATAGTSRGTGHRTGLALGLGAGVGFGLYFVVLDATPPDSGLWPLLAGRVLVLVVLGAVLAARRPTGGLRPSDVRIMIVSGVFDVVANVLFLLSTRYGDLGVSAVVVSLYPVVVVLLARVVLRERLTGLQLVAAGLAVGASALLVVA